MFKILRAKMHCIRVTDSALQYHGSISLDPDHCRACGILPLEFVEIWNKNSGARISTYVIYGEKGSKCCVLNGAAARTCQIGDELIICAYEFINDKSGLLDRKPLILCFDRNNNIEEKLQYNILSDDHGNLIFETNKIK